MKQLKKYFGVVSNWPKLKNAEYEVIERLKISSKKIGYVCCVIDTQGTFLNSSDIEIKDLNFIISLHYDAPKSFQCNTFIALWNPMDFYYKFGLERTINNLLSYDGYLLGSDHDFNNIHNDVMNSYLRLDLKFNKPYFFNSLYDNAFEYKTFLNSQKKIFYVGVNWEAISGKGRFHDLFKMLDSENIIQFYGPKKINGVRPWRGFKSYKGEIPFDGSSLIDTANKLGISLVLSSNSHLMCDMMSSRLFESISAGAIVICDQNRFVKKHFKDNVLYVDTTKTNKLIFNQINSHYNWILRNQNLAAEKIKACQKIFAEKFSYKKTLPSLFTELSNYSLMANKKDNFVSQSHKTKQLIINYVLDSDTVGNFKNNIHTLLKSKTQLLFKINILYSPDRTRKNILAQYTNILDESGLKNEAIPLENLFLFDYFKRREVIRTSELFNFALNSKNKDSIISFIHSDYTILEKFLITAEDFADTNKKICIFNYIKVDDMNINKQLVCDKSFQDNKYIFNYFVRNDSFLDKQNFLISRDISEYDIYKSFNSILLISHISDNLKLESYYKYFINDLFVGLNREDRKLNIIWGIFQYIAVIKIFKFFFYVLTFQFKKLKMIFLNIKNFLINYEN